MPITDTTIIDGPNIQADDGRRGTVQLTFDDGRVFDRQINAVDALDWANKLLDIAAEQEAKVALDDAAAAAEIDTEVEASQEASREQVAVAYLRKAMEIGDPYDAYIKLDRFNNYRLDKGWNLNQVVAGLASAGLTDDEWEAMKDRYIYLSNAGRVTTMVAYAAVLAGDTWGADGR